MNQTTKGDTMSKLTRDGGAAFPRTGTGGMVQEGMSLRAYAAIEFASALLQGWSSKGHHGEDLRNDCVKEGDEMAKAMIKRLEKETA